MRFRTFAMTMRAGRAPRATIVRRFLAGSMLAAALAGCTTAGTQTPAYTGSIGSSAVLTASDLAPEEALAAVQKWGIAYGRDEKDKVTALNYAAALRAAGETKQAVAVMRKAVIYHPEDREVLASFGKALAADGRFRKGLPPSAARSGRTIQTGNCWQRRAASSIRSASTTMRAPSTSRRWC
jgi:hypothetical protein